MKSKNILDNSGASIVSSLYQRAEAALGQRKKQSPEPFAALSPAAAQRTLHDLQVHQVELEMQNEELRRKQVELDESLAHHINFYDLAPAGYCTLTEMGLIREVNLTTATLLNVPRSQLINKPIRSFVFKEDHDRYYALRHSLRDAADSLTCELRLLKRDGAPFWAHLAAAMAHDGDGGSELRLVINDITARKLADLSLAASLESLRVSEEQMDIVQKISHTGSWRYNLVTDEIWGSAEGMRIFGYPPIPSSLPISHFVARIAKQEQQRVHQSLQRLMKEGGHYDLEFTVMPADGSPARITHSLVTLETDAEGKPLKILGFVQDITQAKLGEERVRQLAFLDPLTALPNRRLLLDRIGQALAAAQRSEDFGAVVYLDLDNFKPLNDQHGHAIGDALLMEVARRLLNCVRSVDTVSRIGGYYFVVLLGYLAIEQAQAAEQANKLAEKIRDALEQPYLLPGGTELEPIEHRCSASLGVVLFSKQCQSVEGILKWADAAMYRAKKEGRNRINFMVERRSKQRI